MTKVLLSVFFFIFLLHSFAKAEPTCISYFGKRRFPLEKIADAKGKSHIQFGFEAEYTFKDSEQLLTKYMPDPNISGLTKEQWLAKSHQERLDFIESRKSLYFPEYRNEGKFVKILPDDGYDYLPDSFLLDSGNFEIRIGPFDSLEEWKFAMEQINKEVKVGSMQATVSVPSDSFFAGARPVKENLAIYKAMHEHDTLEKLYKGHLRYKENPNVLSAKSFDHPWLGPDNSDREARLLKYLRDNSQGDYSRVSRVGPEISSHKFIGGTVYRPDIAANTKRIISEVRDCHKNPSCLEQRVDRLINVYSKGRAPFAEASDFIPFDRKMIFGKLENVTAESKNQNLLSRFLRRISKTENSKVTNMLKELYPNYWQNSRGAPEVLDKFLNFSYPLRDWSGHVKVLQNTADELSVDLSYKIKAAQDKYIQDLEDIAHNYASKAISSDQAKIATQAALTEFVENSQLYKVMNKWMETRLAAH